MATCFETIDVSLEGTQEHCEYLALWYCKGRGIESVICEAAHHQAWPPRSSVSLLRSRGWQFTTSCKLNIE